ncbi:putative peptide ABC transporter DppA [Cellulomonas soli]|uniref:Putative peptide ABC transporter DppA n=2 Tax=Cellulomonas soli TaxID=931535 RepID=A0A512PC31_9CELL|nr:putative peptide ABC transporter DppA [Cellulomonas soli]
MTRMSLRLAAGALAASLTLAACGSSDTASDDTTSTTGTGGALSVAVTDPGQLIPGRQTVAYDFAMAVWAPLTWVDDASNLTYIQAESVESDDATTWTITLKDGWTFQDGTPVTAQSYVDAWNTVAYGPNAFENSGQLAHVVGYGDLNPAEGEPTTTEMSGLTVVDDLTFTVQLDGADSQFPMQLSQAQTAMYPMPESAYDDLDAYNTHPVGNGAFELTNDYVENEPLVLDAYADYQGEAPTVSQITFVPYTDTATAYTDVLAGNIDVSDLPADKMAQAEADFGDHVYSFEAAGISYLGLPLSDPRYADVRVRQAISMAIDRDTINDVIYGGLYTPATAFTPAIEPGTPEGICGELCEYDPEGAKALLDEAGGFAGSMEIYYPGGVGLDDLYTAIANNLRQNLGVDAVATPSTDWAEFYQTRLDGDAPGPFFSRWGALYPSQQNTLRAFYVENGGCANCIPWYDPEVASAISAADAQVDGTEAADAYGAVQELILAEFAAPPLFFETYNFVTSDRVAELTTSAVGNPDYAHTVLAEDA